MARVLEAELWTVRRGGLCLTGIASVGFHNVRACDAKSGLDWWNSFGEEHGV